MRYYYPLFLLLALLFQACQEHVQSDFNTWTAWRTQIKQLENTKLTPSNHDSLRGIWHHLYANPAIQTDSVSFTKVNYQLARLYGMKGKDSASYFVQKALDYIEPTQGNLDEKALVYNGMGNILSLQAKPNEASYYYNRAAAIVRSDSLVDLSAEARSAMLLSAAQSNSRVYQLTLSERMIREAMPICDSLPEGHINHQRVLVQMIQTLRARKQPGDSMAPYLQKLEALHQQNPLSYNPSFLYESKVFYFEKTNKTDSLLHYQLLKTQLDEGRYEAGQAQSTAINNLFLDYCNIAATYILLDQFIPAEKYLQKASSLKKEQMDAVLGHNDIYYQKAIASLYAKKGRKDEAVDILDNTLQLQENIYQEHNAQAVAEMNALYQLQAKDRSIQNLNENIKINRLQLQQNRLWLIISLLTLGLLALVIFFLYYSLQQRRVSQEKEKVILQQQLLRTQMEPHFIFNTLSALQSFVRLDQKEHAIKYLNRFSRLLRSSLELSRKQLVPLDEELETLENYLSLQQMRFENAFTYEIISLEEHDMTAVMVPPMLIQPFVENSILHGIDMETGTGRLMIEFNIASDSLEITITDSGKHTMEGSSVGHRSLSGTISRERLHLLGKKAKLQTLYPAEGGTIILLHIPIPS